MQGIISSVLAFSTNKWRWNREEEPPPKKGVNDSGLADGVQRMEGLTTVPMERSVFTVQFPPRVLASYMAISTLLLKASPSSPGFAWGGEPLLISIWKIKRAIEFRVLTDNLDSI